MYINNYHDIKIHIYMLNKRKRKSFFKIVESRFSDRTQCNEFVNSRSKSWVLMRRRLVLEGEKHIESGSPTSQKEGTPHPRTGIPNSFRIPGAPLLSLGLLLFGRHPTLWVISVVIYSSLPFILLLHLSIIHEYP